MIKALSIDLSADWDKLVRSFSDYDVYWLSGYVKAFQLHGDGEPLLFYYERKGSAVRGINVVMKRDIADAEQFSGKLEHGKYFDFSTPYGYGGWLIENPNGESLAPLFAEYMEYCKSLNIISEFVRFHPMLENQEACKDAYEIVRLGEVVHMDLSSPETIWDNLTSKNRGHLRQALKSGVKIYNGRYPQIFEEFRRIYEGTMDKDRADKYYYFKESFYRSILEDLPHNAQVFYAVLPDGTIIAASIMLMANGRMNYHLSGNLKQYNSMAGTNLLLYQAALWGHANGCSTLYLGGGVGSEEDSLLKFKKSFNKGKLNHFYIGKKIFDQNTYDQLVAMREDIHAARNEITFFPEYRVKQ